MTKFDKQFEKGLFKTRDGVLDLAKWGISKGITAQDRFRLTKEARREEVRELNKKGLSLRQIGKATGVGKTQVSRDLSLKGTKTVPKWDKPKGRILSKGNGRAAPPPEIRLGDFTKVLSDIKDESVTLIFTDPPYDQKSIKLYGELAEFAARVLKPGGSLLAYCGHYAIPEIMAWCKPHLKWHWMLGCYHRGGAHKSLPGIGVYVTWKPILWFVKPPFSRPEEFVEDMIDRPPPDKSADSWAQSIEDARYYIGMMTLPGDLIIDPFAGTGTTILAARELGRTIIAAEKNKDVIASAAERLAAT